MGHGEYDLIVIGGGLGGAALAKAMAENRRQVLVLEREKIFRDRVRGEFMCPWGVVEARELGLYELIRNAAGTDVRFVEMGFGRRDLTATTPQRLPALTFYHPEMQEAVLCAAAASGAEVRRGATVTGIEPGLRPSVAIEQDGRHEKASARLIVAADGRGSAARKWAGFDVQIQHEPFLFAGLMLEDMSTPIDAAFLIFNPDVALLTGITPTGKGRSRVYVGYESRSGYRLQGNENVVRFMESSKRAAPLAADLFARARPSGPLASFPSGDFWVNHPSKDGIVLVGDAAGTSDPAFGQGLSLTMRDTRVLRDKLLSNDDWRVAADAYAEEHDRYFAILHKVTGWMREIFVEQGPEATLKRSKAMPLIAEDQTRVPDHLFSGPELLADDAVKMRFFGEQ